jgi:hypothetical protein
MPDTIADVGVSPGGRPVLTFPYKEEVGGSIPSTPTRNACHYWVFRASGCELIHLGPRLVRVRVPEAPNGLDPCPLIESPARCREHIENGSHRRVVRAACHQSTVLTCVGERGLSKIGTRVAGPGWAGCCCRWGPSAAPVRGELLLCPQPSAQRLLPFSSRRHKGSGREERGRGHAEDGDTSENEEGATSGPRTRLSAGSQYLTPSP